MPVVQALRLCPQLILVQGTYALYSELSEKVFEVLKRFTPVLEQVSVDEGYLDMTGTRLLWGESIEAGSRIREAVLKETGLVCSIGIASNRLVAKVATDHCKPDGLIEISPGEEASFLAPMSVRKLPGVGPASAEWLEARGLRLIRDLQQFPEDALERRYGRYGVWLARAARGEGSVEFHEPAKSRSSSRERTFRENVGDREVLRAKLWELCQDLGAQLRQDGDWARSIRLKLRYADFETPVRSRTCEHPLCTDEDLFRVVVELLDRHWDSNRPLRLIGIGAVLGDEGTGPRRQWGLFENPRQELKREGLAKLRDRLREKFGDDIIKSEMPE
jgi:DNA polymerase-4